MENKCDEAVEQNRGRKSEEKTKCKNIISKADACLLTAPKLISKSNIGPMIMQTDLLLLGILCVLMRTMNPAFSSTG